MDRKKLALIHIIKKELQLTDEEYRSVLRNTAGVSSAKDLDEKGFRKLMQYLVRDKRYQLNEGGLTLKQRLYLEHLARDLGWDESHLNNFIHKYYHKSGVQALTRREAIKAIESLKHVRNHR